MKKIILITMLMSAVFAQADECEAETIDTQCNALDSQSDREECRRYYYLLCENTLTEDELKEIEALEEADRKWAAEKKRKREEEIAKKEAERLAKLEEKERLAKKEAERLAKLKAKNDLAKRLVNQRFTMEEYRDWPSAEDSDKFTWKQIDKNIKTYGIVATREYASDMGSLDYLYQELEAAFSATHLENNITRTTIHTFGMPNIGFSCSQLMAGMGEDLLLHFYEAIAPKPWTAEERKRCDSRFSRPSGADGDGGDDEFCAGVLGDRMYDAGSVNFDTGHSLQSNQRLELVGSQFLYMSPSCHMGDGGQYIFLVDVLLSHPNKEAEQEILEAMHKRIEQAKHDASDDGLELEPN
jgi:hypothetical protein